MKHQRRSGLAALVFLVLGATASGETVRYVDDNAPLDGDGMNWSTAYRFLQDALAEAADNAIVLHPGPINRGVEISSEVADGRNSVILDQVANGVAIRMARLYLLARRASTSAEERHGG